MCCLADVGALPVVLYMAHQWVIYSENARIEIQKDVACVVRWLVTGMNCIWTACSEVCRTRYRTWATTWTNLRYVSLSCARQTRFGNRNGETSPLSEVVWPLFPLASLASFSPHWTQHDVFGEWVVAWIVTEVFQFVRLDTGSLCTVPSIVMRPSCLGGGRILRRTLSVCLSVCLSVRPVRGSSFLILQ